MTSFRAYVASGCDWLRRTSCKPLLLLTAICLLVQEQFPFSHFPMYSSFTDKTFYVHLADGSGEAIATPVSTGLRSSQLKKVYEQELMKEKKRPGRSRHASPTLEEKRRAGERVLATLRSSQWVRRRRSKFPQVVQLYEVTIRLRQNRLEKESVLIAQSP